MKYDILHLFLRREHLIIITRVTLISDMNPGHEQYIHQIEAANQREEQPYFQIKWSMVDLDYLQNQLLQIANLTFSYYKLHFPLNSSLQIKDHIKFISLIRQLNYNGTSLEDIFKWQRYRLQQDRMKLLRQQKMIEEPIYPKIANYKIDLSYFAQLLCKYYNKKSDYKQLYSILNLHQKKKLQRINNRICMSITSLEDVPQLQLINTNLIQPILNYDQLNSTFQKRMIKLVNRNQLVQQSIRRYYVQRNQQIYSQPCLQIQIDDSPRQVRHSMDHELEQRSQRVNYRFIRAVDRGDKQFLKPINYAKESLETVLEQKITRHHTSSERDEAKQISRSQLIRSVKSEHLLLESEMYKKFLQPIKQSKFKIKQK